MDPVVLTFYLPKALDICLDFFALWSQVTADLPEETKTLCHRRICVSNDSVTVLCLNRIAMTVSKMNKTYCACLNFSLVLDFHYLLLPRNRYNHQHWWLARCRDPNSEEIFLSLHQIRNSAESEKKKYNGLNRREYSGNHCKEMV